MNTAEKLGVKVINPETVISIGGGTFGEVIASLGMHVETLRKVNAVLNQANPDGGNEQLAEVQNAIIATMHATMVLLYEHLNWAREQGLRFELTNSDAVKH